MRYIFILYGKILTINKVKFGIMESWIATPFTKWKSNSLIIALNVVLLFKSACLNDILNGTGLFVFTR